MENFHQREANSQLLSQEVCGLEIGVCGRIWGIVLFHRLLFRPFAGWKWRFVLQSPVGDVDQIQILPGGNGLRPRRALDKYW